MSSTSRRARACVRAAACLLGLALTAPAVASAAPGEVSAFPAPGTPVVSPTTQISLRGAPLSQLQGRLQVRGSRSGPHGGTWKAHGDGRGASFLPSRAFAAGETVTVQTSLKVPGASGGRFTYGVARFAKPLPRLTRKIAKGTPLHTLPDLAPPRPRVTTRSDETEPGYLFVTPKLGAGQWGPMMLDDNGSLRWFRSVPATEVATDVRVQERFGQPVLTWWEGSFAGSSGSGASVIADSSYRVLQRVRAGNGFQVNLHEFRLTPQGSALITAYQPVHWDLSPVGGPRDGVVVDGIVQEVDLRTGLVLFEWHSLGQIPLDESSQPVSRKPGHPHDYVHLNAVDLLGSGELLVSARRTSTIYALGRRSGRIVWRLGGKRSSFKMGPGTSFSLQHDARAQPDGTISLFANYTKERNERSSAMRIKLDVKARTATLARSLPSPANLRSASQGNAQALPNGDTLVGWGSVPVVSELSPKGRQLFRMAMPKGYDTYRAYRMPWNGRPADAPRAAATPAANGKSMVYASWNGSTEVIRWEVLAGATATTLKPLGFAPWRDLETSMTVPSAGPYFQVRAYDAAGTMLRASAVVKRAG